MTSPVSSFSGFSSQLSGFNPLLDESSDSDDLDDALSDVSSVNTEDLSDVSDDALSIDDDEDGWETASELDGLDSQASQINQNWSTDEQNVVNVPAFEEDFGPQHTQKAKKAAKICPTCSKTFARLDRHLVRVHGLTIKDAKNLARSSRTFQGRKRKICPLENCNKPVAKADLHLVRYHKMQRGSAEYLLARAHFTKNPNALPTVPIDLGKHASLVMTGFLEWIMSMKGKALPKKQAKQHLTQAENTLKELGDNINPDMKDVTATKLEAWVETQMISTTRRPGTTRSYLISLSCFLQYKTEKNELGEEAAGCVDLCRHFSRNMRKLAAERQAQVRLDAASDLLPAGGPLAYFTTDFHQQACQLAADPAQLATQEGYLVARDAAILTLILVSGQRASALLGMTLHDVGQAMSSMVQGEIYHTVTVAHHKTGICRGPANFPLNPGQFQLITHLKNFMLARPGAIPTGPIFTSFDGECMSSSSINKALSRAWRLSVCEGKHGSLNCTKYRKTLTSMVKDELPAMGPALAQQLTHSLATADAYYAVKQEQTNSAKTTHVLEHVANKEDNQKEIAVGQASSMAMSVFNALDPVCFYSPEHELEEGIRITCPCPKLTKMTQQAPLSVDNTHPVAGPSGIRAEQNQLEMKPVVRLGRVSTRTPPASLLLAKVKPPIRPKIRAQAQRWTPQQQMELQELMAVELSSYRDKRIPSSLIHQRLAASALVTSFRFGQIRDKLWNVQKKRIEDK